MSECTGRIEQVYKVPFSPDPSTLFFLSSAAQVYIVPTANQIMKRIAGQAHLHCTSWIGLCGSCTTTQGLGIIFDCPLDFSVLRTFFHYDHRF